MKQYKYSTKRHLVKYCPCGKDNKNGKFAPFDGFDKFGYCFSCDKTFYPHDDKTLTNGIPIKDLPKVEPSFHNNDLVKSSSKNYKQNNFVQFLRSLFADEEVQQAILKYLIGTSKRWHGASVFWQIDDLQRICAGKVLQYDAKTGKRTKDENSKPLIDWVHSILKRSKNINDFTLRQCLFGLHLINAKGIHTIGLVESEKTAIIMSVFKPEYTWLATGSKSGLKYEFLLPIKKYRIVAFPDKSEYNDWLDKATDLNKFGFNISVNDWLEQQSQYAKGTDLADVYIDVKDNVTYSDTEYAIHRIEKHTPEIWELINTFDLVDYYGNDIKKIERMNHNI